MQSVNTRMRRAVEKENQDLDAKINDRKKPKKRKVRRKPVNACLGLIVLSPLLIIGALVLVMKQYSIWSAVEAELENVTPGEADLNKVVSPKAGLKRLRNGKPEKHATAIDSKKAEKKKPRAKESSAEIISKPKYLVLVTKQGNIKITLRPDLSQGSVDYVYKLVESYGGNGQRCMHCNFYRAEKPGILQGIMENKGKVLPNSVRGSCPPGAEDVANNCPEWDKHCGCHGPVMTRGAVAWAAGDSGGPDFFINAYPNPADWWGTQHTNFGFIEDEESMKVVDGIFELPVEETADMTFLKDIIHFDLTLE